MAKFKAGGGVAEVEINENPEVDALNALKHKDENASDAFDAWASVLSGDAMAEISEGLEAAEEERPDASETGVQEPQAADVTVTELPPVTITPLEPVAVAECEVVEVRAVEVDGGDETLCRTCCLVAVKEAGEECESCKTKYKDKPDDEAALATTSPLELPAVSAAKTDYLTACLRLSAVEVRLDNLSGEIEEAEAALEQLKERREQLQERTEPQHTEVMILYEKLAALLGPEEMEQYTADIERWMVAISDPDSLPPSSSCGDSLPSCSSSSPSTASPATTDASVGWRLRPTKELDFSLVKGLGQKKVSAILETCPTIGDFEDMRAGHSKDGKPGLTQIPGVGVKLAGELENLMLDWLAKNRDWGVLKEASEAQLTPPPTLQQTTFLPGDAVATCGNPPSATTSDQQSGDVLPPETTAEPPAAGEASTSEDGQPADEPPAGSLPADKQPSDGKPPPTPQEAAEIAALASRFKELYSAFRDHGQSGFAAKDEWSQYASMGKDDYINGLKFEDCVFTAGDRQDHWLWGFIEGMIESKRA
jgi:hypothetical protein